MTRIGFLIDLDGVVYWGAEPIPEAIAFLKSIATIPRLFLTNNSSVTPAEIIGKLEKFGLGGVPRDSILTSAQATASWLADRHPGFRYYVVGGKGINEALAQFGTWSSHGPEFVVVGEGPGISFETITRGVNMLSGRDCPAQLIGTNLDRKIDTTIDGKRAMLPGAGALIAPFEVATGVKPIFVGKPYPPMYLTAMCRLGVKPANCCMIGDRPDTDILGAARLGLITVLVRTGCFAPGEPWSQDWPPDLPRADFDVNSLADIDLASLQRRLEESQWRLPDGSAGSGCDDDLDDIARSCGQCRDVLLP